MEAEKTFAKMGTHLETQQKKEKKERESKRALLLSKPLLDQDGAFSASAEILFGKKQKTGRGNGRECHEKGQGQLAGATALGCSSQLGRVEKRMDALRGQDVASEPRGFSKAPEEAIFSKPWVGHAVFLTSERNLQEIAKIHQESLKC